MEQKKTKRDILVEMLETTVNVFENSRYPEEERKKHPIWEAWITMSCAAFRWIIKSSPTCPPDCGPPD